MLRRELDKNYGFSEIIGKSEALQKVFRIVEKVADTNVSILIQGESGTGKELIARSIHFNSDRAGKPFLAVNCGALCRNLYLNRNFSDTQKVLLRERLLIKKGLFRSADGGTILLDEIGEMPQPLQVKLLRALQEQEVTPVGSSKPIKFDARIIAATNKNLEDGSCRKSFPRRFILSLECNRNFPSAFEKTPRGYSAACKAFYFKDFAGTKRVCKTNFKVGIVGFGQLQLARQRPRIAKCDRTCFYFK